MSLNPGGENSYGWNYSKPDKPDYSTQLVGTVLAIQEVQKRGFTMTGQPGAPQFWPDGNPMMNIRLALATQDGELRTFTFQPAGKKARMGEKRSVHMDLFALTGNTDMMNLVGKTISIQTQEGHYGQGNPRPWYVSLVEAGPYQLNMPLPPEFKAPQVLANTAASGGQVNAPQQQQGYGYQQPPMQQQGYGYQQQPMQQPPMQPAYQQNPMQQPSMQRPMMQQQPAYQQPMQPPMQQQGYGYQQPPMQQQQPMQQVQPPMQQQAQDYPVGMDPNIVQAMATEVFGDGVQVTMEHAEQTDPVGAGQVYDSDTPF